MCLVEGLFLFYAAEINQDGFLKKCSTETSRNVCHKSAFMREAFEEVKMLSFELPDKLHTCRRILNIIAALKTAYE